jgi:prepilin-type N-terminal cleavage/methylation domain-containing protein/prepilin-type processing-associated H-X9-DG protein
VSVRRRGFTLIELLVVIAIIGILAAMLFPVFARARESARKTQCLANVKNIAMAVQIYLTDYDMLWPKEHRPEVIYGAPVGDPGGTSNCDLAASTEMNPYLKPPVILEEYTKSREIWSCPSARTTGSYGIINPLGMDWWARVNLVDPSRWSNYYKVAPCQDPYPTGWGGTVTDSITQLWSKSGDGGPGAFTNSLNVGDKREVKTSEMNDSSRYVIAGEASMGGTITDPLSLAYPDLYRMCGANPGSVACCNGSYADWANCSWTRDCGAEPGLNYADTEVRKKHAFPRHMGGSNVGFADGHAKWFNSEDILNNYAPDQSYRYDCYAINSSVKAQRAQRSIWDGFEHGICGMWGAFGLSPKGCS